MEGDKAQPPLVQDGGSPQGLGEGCGEVADEGGVENTAPEAKKSDACVNNPGRGRVESARPYSAKGVLSGGFASTGYGYERVRRERTEENEQT